MSKLKTKDLNKSRTKTSVKKGWDEIATKTTNNLLVPETMRASPMIVNIENHVKWEKKRVEKVMNNLIYQATEKLTTTLIDIAIDERNPNAINSLLDRGFGRARQNIGLDGGATDKPIVFLPAELMEKYAIKQGTKDVYTPVEPNPDE
jgi:hypothetical protein